MTYIVEDKGSKITSEIRDVDARVSWREVRDISGGRG